MGIENASNMSRSTSFVGGMKKDYGLKFALILFRPKLNSLSGIYFGLTNGTWALITTFNFKHVIGQCTIHIHRLTFKMAPSLPPCIDGVV